MTPLRCILAAGMAFLAGTVISHALQIMGSDLLGDTFSKAFEAELQAAGVEATLNLSGSLLGQRELEAGRVQAALLAIPDGAAPVTGQQRFPLGSQIVAVAVHSSNPVQEVTYGQLVEIFRDNGQIGSWADLTKAPEWRDRKISLIVSRQEDSATLELFNAYVIKGQRMRPSVRYLPLRTEQLVAAISQDPSAVALAPATASGPAIKLLAVKRSPEQQAYTPTPDNVFFGDYPLRLPFYLVVSDTLDRQTLAGLVKALYSEAVTTALIRENYMPVPEPEQRSFLVQFD